MPLKGEALDHGPEQERRDLQVEDGALGVPKRVGYARVGPFVGEVAGHVAQPLGEALEHALVDRLAAPFDQVCAWERS